MINLILTVLSQITQVLLLGMAVKIIVQKKVLMTWKKKEFNMRWSNQEYG